MGAEFYGESYKGNDEPIFGGIPTFLKLPWLRTHEELKKVKPDVAIIGEPFDFGTTIRPGARYGPRAIRAASTVPSPPYVHFKGCVVSSTTMGPTLEELWNWAA